MNQDPKIITRIVAWNRKRNGLRFDPTLEIRLLSEEAHEFFTAERLPDMVREFADFIFVSIGTVSKYSAMQYESTHGFLMSFDGISQVEEWIEGIKDKMESMLREHLGNELEEIMNQAVLIVLEANEAKGTEKDDHGKILKGGSYTDPIEEIESLLWDYEVWKGN